MIAFPMILLAVSPTPMGHTPGLLSSAIRRHAVRGAISCGSTYVVPILFATRARLLQRSAEGHWKDVHSCFHPTESRPGGPAEPFVRMAALRMAIPLMDSN